MDLNIGIRTIMGIHSSNLSSRDSSSNNRQDLSSSNSNPASNLRHRHNRTDHNRAGRPRRVLTVRNWDRRNSTGPRHR